MRSESWLRLMSGLVLVGIFAAGTLFGAGLMKWTAPAPQQLPAPPPPGPIPGPIGPPGPCCGGGPPPSVGWADS